MPLPVGSVSQYELRNSKNYVLPNESIRKYQKVLISLYYPGLEQSKPGYKNFW
jgi:hypothetical protein